MAKKKKILYHSNYSKILTGFGKNAKNILRYLCLTGKYEVVELSNGIAQSQPDLDKLPWKAVGGIPADQSVIDKINKDPNLSRQAQYGMLGIDDVIKQEKPDVYIGVEDIWGISPFTKKTWWNKINCMVWTTLDSLPLLPDAVKVAPKIKNYFVWASFAEKAMKKLGHDHVKTLHGAIDCSNFNNLGPEGKSVLRKTFNISEDSFVIGYVFRNQLRKSVPNLLEGFKLFKQKNPKSKAKLLLHTNFAEGWDIQSLVEEKGIDPNDILCTYYCSACRRYEVKVFQGQKLQCPFCGAKESQNTVSIVHGVDEKQLNEVYNLMDVYCHPFTSGGQEIPIQEAKLCELITLVTNYSCGEDMCSDESAGFALDWSEYREPGTQFIKASTSPNSISNKLTKVFKMDQLKRSSLGKKARDFVINNYSVEVIGKKLESILDSMPDNNYDFSFEPEKRDPNYIPPDIEDDSDWLIDLYKNILKVDLDQHDSGHKHWMQALKNGATRQSIVDYFKSVAVQENSKLESSNMIDLSDLIKNSGNKKALFCVSTSEEDVLLVSTLLESFKNNNKDCDIFFATDPKFFPIIDCNPNVFKCIPYQNGLEDERSMLGANLKEGQKYFDHCYNFNFILRDHSMGASIENKVYNIYE